MTLNGVIFDALAILMVVSTVLAVTRRLAVHVVVYLMISFLATGLMFYLLGAPFLAALEVIIYAGGIMVLFLFVVMTVRWESEKRTVGETARQWFPAIILSLISLLIAGFLIFQVPDSRVSLTALTVTPVAFGHYVFEQYWFPVEIASFLLLIGLVGALYLGKQERMIKSDTEEKS
jgi:NADH-quinone oxidoreductase subunit J